MVILVHFKKENLKMILPFAILVMCVAYLAGTPDVHTFNELTKLDIVVMILTPLSFVSLVRSI